MAKEQGTPESSRCEGIADDDGTQDIHWYNREKDDDADARAAEMKRIKQAEEDAMNLALYVAPLHGIPESLYVCADNEKRLQRLQTCRPRRPRRARAEGARTDSQEGRSQGFEAHREGGAAS